MLAVVYLIFNEGYGAAEGDRLVRGELCSEAIRLGRLLARLMPDEAEVGGLLALMLLHDARRAARVDEHGRYVGLEDQDRSLWDRGRIREGLRMLERALRLGRPGPYQLQAAIAALHVDAPSFDDTDWAQIAQLYGALARLGALAGRRAQPRRGGGVRGGRRARAGAPAPLLANPRLERYQPLHAAHAELLRRAGDRGGAAAAYERAIALSANMVQRVELERRLGALSSG